MTYKPKLIDIRGKKYMPVNERIAWFRDEKKDWSIKTSIAHQTDEGAVIMKALILNETGQVKATGHGFFSLAQSKNISGRFVEKAETAAVGRALAILGYGTTQAPELEEDFTHDLADAPQ